MGIFDKWSKKKEAEQLQAANKKGQVKVSESKVGKEDKEEKKVPAKSAGTTAKKNAKTNDNAFKILLRPVISEKAAIAESNSSFTFVVQNKATKIDVKNAIKEVYNVKPLKIRMINVEGKNLRFGRNFGKRKDWKKAIVTLAKGQSINIHEGV